MELFNTIVGTLGLIIAIIALLHSIYYNLVKIRLTPIKVERIDKNYQYLYTFYVGNLSNISVIIKKIEIFDNEGNLLKDNGFNPAQIRQQEYENIKRQRHNIFSDFKLFDLSEEWFSSPFTNEIDIYPASKEMFSYYLDKKPYMIKITADKRIHKFRKHQSFIAHFDNNNQNSDIS